MAQIVMLSLFLLLVWWKWGAILKFIYKTDNKRNKEFNKVIKLKDKVKRKKK